MKSFKTSVLFIIMMSAFAVILIACGGGGGGGSDGGGGGSDGGGGGGNTSTGDNPQVAGFNFTISEGTYWEYNWTYKYTSLAQGSSGSIKYDGGNFRVTLGSPTVIAGVTAYPVTITGDSAESIDKNNNYAPRWKYIAVNNHQILGSTDGATLHVIFDAKTGTWQGGGFFAEFSDAANLTAATGAIDNQFTKTSAILASQSAGQTQCETIAGYTVCPNDTEFSLSETEYYKGGIGPLGYHYSLGWSSSGGGFYTSFSRELNIGLVATSLTADDGFMPELPPWEKKTDMPYERSYFSTAVVNNKVYVLGGMDTQGASTNTVSVYDPATDSWTTGTPMPATMSSPTSAVINGKIYVIDKNSAMLEYNPATNQWTIKLGTPTFGYNPTSVAEGGYIWVIGSEDKTVSAYAPSTGWSYSTPIPSLWSNRIGWTVTAVNGKVYLLGGLLQTIGIACTVESYRLDLSKSYGAPDAWSKQMALMSVGRAYLTSAVVDGKIYTIGGNCGSEYKDAVEMYDPATDTWTTKTPLSKPGTYLRSAVVNNKIYIFGWYKEVYEYDPANDN